LIEEQDPLGAIFHTLLPEVDTFVVDDRSRNPLYHEENVTCARCAVACAIQVHNIGIFHHIFFDFPNVRLESLSSCWRGVESILEGAM